MHKILAAAALLVGLLAIVPTAATASPLTQVQAQAQAQAQAQGRRSCVTKAEFRRAKRGMIKRRVHRIFDTRGRRTSLSIGGGTRDEYREYRACAGDRWSYVTVNYDNYMNPKAHLRGMRVYSKDMYISR
jgi:hypothetical protein